MSFVDRIPTREDDPVLQGIWKRWLDLALNWPTPTWIDAAGYGAHDPRAARPGNSDWSPAPWQ